jgi:hypothetical protein
MVKAKSWSYFQLVLGFAIGYWIVAGMLLTALLPHGPHQHLWLPARAVRYGELSHGRVLLHPLRLAGATIRIFVVLNVIQLFVLDAMGAYPSRSRPLW